MRKYFKGITIKVLLASGLLALAVPAFATGEPAAEAPAASSGVAMGSSGFNDMLGKQIKPGTFTTEELGDGTYRLHNSMQTVSAHVTPNGTQFDSVGNSAGKGGFTLALAQWGRAGALQQAASSKIYRDGDAVFHTHAGGIAEKFSNTSGGIRQDFIVPIKPQGEGELHVQLEVSGANVVEKNDGVTVQLASGRQLTYDRLVVTDNTGKKVDARIRVLAQNTIDVSVDDSAAQYPLTIDPTVGDENWVSMGGFAGVNAQINCVTIVGNVIYVAGNFTAAGNVKASNIAQWDGSSWRSVGQGLNGGVSALVADGMGNIYAGGGFSFSGDIPVQNVAKWNGITWSAMGSGTDSTVLALAVGINNEIFVGGWFQQAGGVTVNYIAKWQGGSWQALGSGMNNYGAVRSLVVDGTGKLYAAGFFTQSGGMYTNGLAVWNGVSWSDLGSYFDGAVTTMAVDNANNLYVAGEFTKAGGTTVNHIAKWNGTGWSAIGNGILFGSISAVAVDKNNKLYILGDFSNPGGYGSSYDIRYWDGVSWLQLAVPMHAYSLVKALIFDDENNLYAYGANKVAGGIAVGGIAVWNGSVWSALGSQNIGLSGVNSVVKALAIDSNGKVYAGGTFSAAAGLSVHNVAVWDGSAWSALGSGFDGEVRALTVDSLGRVYAGGAFHFSGGISANGIAVWNGSAWESLGSGVDLNGVAALALDNGNNLFVGGNFGHAGGVTANNIAKWDGHSWYALSSGVANGSVYAITIDKNNNIFVGGSFSIMGGLSANNIARWDGGNWSALGPGVNGFVAAMAVDKNNNLYVCGGFTVAGGTSAKNIARWNGVSWYPVGQGISGSAGNGNYINAIAIDESGKVYVGGSFTLAGNSTVSNIAEWNGFSWKSLGSGVSDQLYALVLDGMQNLYAGGMFVVAGDLASANVASWHFVDADGDGWQDYEDAFPNDPTKWLDSDVDGIDDSSDNCPLISNVDQADMDHDGIGDACDSDIDGDGVANEQDAFPMNTLEWSDVDHDGFGDNSDPDIDGDGIANVQDAFPLDASAWLDTDGDGYPDQVFSLSDNFETGDLSKLPWNSFSDAQWLTSPANAHAGSYAARSGDVEYGATSVLSLAVDTGAQVSFYLAVTEQQCGNSWMEFIVDGVSVNFWYDFSCSGISWQQFTMALTPGQHTFEWYYTSYDPVGNAAWLDDFNLGSSLVADNCSLVANGDQADMDHDGGGDVCDADADGDGVANYIDSDPLNAAINTEKRLPVNSSYKGSFVRENNLR